MIPHLSGDPQRYYETMVRYHKILNYYHQTTLSNLVVDILLSTCLEETLDSLSSDTSIDRILGTTVRHNMHPLQQHRSAADVSRPS